MVASHSSPNISINNSRPLSSPLAVSPAGKLVCGDDLEAIGGQVMQTLSKRP